MVELKKTRRLYAMKVIKKELVTDDEVRPMRQKPVIFQHCVSKSSPQSRIGLRVNSFREH